MTDERVLAWGDELRRVHARLREALAITRESVTRPHPAGQLSEPVPRDLLVFCWGFCAALSGHHRSEDGNLFPGLVQARPDLAPVVAALAQDHSMIAQLLAEFERALRAGASSAETLSHLDGLEAVMESHFSYEERQLVTVLNAGQGLGQHSSTELFGAIS